MNDSKLAVRDLAVICGGTTILSIPALDISQGEVLTVIGPNGAGKSTLVHVLALLEQPTSGTILFEGKPIADALAYRRRVAVVFQEPLLLDTSVEENVALGLRLRGVARPQRRARALEWLERLGVSHLARRSARTLSGGEAQRVSLARAFALEPELLFLDEPLAALDQVTREGLLNDLQAILAESGTTALFITHDRAEALRLGHRVAVLMGGHLRQVGAPWQVFSSPVDEEVAAFVGVETIVPGQVTAEQDGLATITVGEQTVEAATAGPVPQEVLVALRPEEVVLWPPTEGLAASSARNRLPGTVRRLSPAGTQVRVEVDCGFTLVALVTRRSLEEMELRVGSPVVATFKAAAVHLIPHHRQAPP